MRLYFCPQHLYSCIVGITLMEQVVQEEMDEEIKKDSNFMTPIDMSYKTIGTLKDPQSQKPHYVHSIIQVGTFCKTLNANHN